MTILNYQPKQPRPVPWRKLLVILIASTLCGWLTFADYDVRDIMVCEDCGLRITAHHWYGFAAFTTQQLRASPLTDVLTAHHLLPKGPHRWVYCGTSRYSLAGSRCYECVFGDPIAVDQNASDIMSGFFENLYSYADPATAELWHRRFLNRSTARAAKHAFEADPELLTDTFDKFPTKKDFDRWWAKARPALDARFAGASR